VTLENNVREIEYLDQAIALDPGFAAAWARKSFAHAYAHGLLREKGESENAAAAMRAAQHAIALEPNLGLAHAALGQAWSLGPNLVQAEDQYRKAIALGQRLAEVGPEYATLQLAVGNIEKARALFRDAREVDPLNPTILAFLLGSHHMLGDTALALAEYERHRTLHGHHLFADFLTDVGLLGGDVSSPSGLPLQADEIDQAAAEHFDAPERALQQLHVLYADPRYADWFSRRRLAMWAAHFGDPELALKAMNDAATATPEHLFLLWFPLFSEVRQQPGFKDLMREHGIVAHWRRYGWPKYCRSTGGDDFECS
jgi:tetratricopeptide (TPR) repeat protein